MLVESDLKKKNSFWSTKRRWGLDAVLAISAVIVIASSLYFLYLPNGYQGGRNPYYDIVILFVRETWDVLHTWGGILMILISLVHITVHWKWFLRMGRRTWLQVLGKTGKINTRGRINLWANLLLVASFVLCGVSGVYFLFVSGSRQAIDPGILFSKTVWDLIHTWAGIGMIGAALVHFAIHWRWVINNAKRLVHNIPGSLRSTPALVDESVS
jgi:Domain of unknown function (DUF4405)